MFEARVGQVWKDGDGHFLVKKIFDRISNEYQIEAYFINGRYAGLTQFWYLYADDELVCDTVDNPNSLG
jgi:hypothetical protein